MKRTLLFLILTVFISGISFGQAVKSAQQISDNQSQAIFSVIKLGDQQKSEVKAITLAAAEKFIQAGKSIDSNVDYEKEITKITSDRDTKIKDILTPDQDQAYDKLVKDKKLEFK